MCCYLTHLFLALFLPAPGCSRSPRFRRFHSECVKSYYLDSFTEGANREEELASPRPAIVHMNLNFSRVYAIYRYRLFSFDTHFVHTMSLSLSLPFRSRRSEIGPVLETVARIQSSEKNSRASLETIFCHITKVFGSLRWSSFRNPLNA